MKRIIIACAFCAVAGASSGYVGGKWFRPDNQTEQKEVAERDSGNRPGRFILWGNDRNSIPGHASGQPFVLGDNSLDLVMKIRQGKMTPDELKDEFQRIMKEIKEEGSFNSSFYDQKRNILVLTLVRQWALSAPHQALEEIEKDKTRLGYMMQDSLIHIILNGWAERDPEAAAQYYMENREKLSIGGPLYYIEEWAKTDPQGAWRNLEPLSKYEKRNGVYAFFKSIFHSQPEKAGEFMNKLDESLWGNDNLLSYIVDQWNQSDKEGMDNWMEGLPSEQQEKLKVFNVMNMVEKSPEEAGKVFSAMSAEDQERALKVIGGKLNDYMNAKEVIDWMSKYATEDVLAEKAPEYIMKFERESSEGLYTWIKELPEGKLRENVLRQYAFLEDSEEVDYSARAELVQTIKDDEERDSTFQRIFYQWSEKNPEESMKWLETASVQDEMKNNLMSNIKRVIEPKGENTSLFKE